MDTTIQVGRTWTSSEIFALCRETDADFQARLRQMAPVAGRDSCGSRSTGRSASPHAKPGAESFPRERRRIPATFLEVARLASPRRDCRSIRETRLATCRNNRGPLRVSDNRWRSGSAWIWRRMCLDSIEDRAVTTGQRFQKILVDRRQMAHCPQGMIGPGKGLIQKMLGGDRVEDGVQRGLRPVICGQNVVMKRLRHDKLPR